MYKQSRKHFIHRSILRTIEVEDWNPLVDLFQAPIVEPLQPVKTEYHPCAPIHVSEATNQNNITVIEDLFLRQSGRDKEDPFFASGLALCSGDLKTVERMLAIKKSGF